MSEAEIQETIERIRSGDKEAFSVIIKHLGPYGWSLARRMMPSVADAEDALQEAFIRCFRSIHQFQGSSQIKTWFYRVVYTTCLNMLKRRGRIVRWEESTPDIDVADYTEPISTIHSELAPLLLQELSTLPVSYRTVMSMFYIQNLSHQEIHDITGMPVGTIKTTLHRGRQRLRTVMTVHRQNIEEHH